ncbi:MAG TPA: hypothetical protein VGJ32_08640, partial [Solirubrobacteraceae bacterium]
ARAPGLTAAAAAVDRDDYPSAIAIARRLSGDDELRIRRKIGRRLARRATDALRAHDGLAARRLLAQARQYPDSRALRAARARAGGGR